MSKSNTGNSSQLAHLVRRFFASLGQRSPDPSDVVWVKETLLQAEFELWEKMSPSDQRHSIAVAQMARSELPNDVTTMRAGLLHDIGKIGVPSGLITRVAAAISKPLATEDRVNRWSQGMDHWQVSAHSCHTRNSAPACFEKLAAMTSPLCGLPNIICPQPSGPWSAQERRSCSARTNSRCKKVVWKRQKSQSD